MMTRTRIFLTLMLVAAVAMLVGLAASATVARRLAPHTPDPRPEATEPHQPSGMVTNV